jgi:SARP family transcriptional regulator, regulator of embCAB operon
LIKVGVLGPLTLTYDDNSYTPTPPKTRQLLALLALHANQVVATEDCLRELWESDPPKSAVSTLRTYVLQIRKTLRKISLNHSVAAAEEMLVTMNQCFRLTIEPESVDCLVFERLYREGYEAAQLGDPRRASTSYAEALSLWRGPALVDVPKGPLVSSHLSKLAERRLGALEQRIEADLGLGRHRELLGELEVLIGQYPTNENIYAQCMLALHRSGRRGQAIEVFRRLCTTLDQDFGIEPSPRIQRLHGAVLSNDPSLETHAAGGAARALRSAG